MATDDPTKISAGSHSDVEITKAEGESQSQDRATGSTPGDQKSSAGSRPDRGWHAT